MYKLITESDIEKDNFVERILNNRGIKDIEKFLEPSKDDVIHYSNLKNMDKAVELFHNVQDKDSAVIAVVIDSDADGFTSSAILVSYIEEHFPHIKIVYFFHENKEHGLTKFVMDNIIKSNAEEKIDLLIIPDAGTSDYKEQCKLSEDYDIPIIVLDHHEPENGESEFAIIVNNQISPKYSNKQFSGVGIVYKFLQALDDKYLFMGADYYLDLVAIGNIADSMDLTSPETRYYVYEGLRNIKNKFIEEMVRNNIGDDSNRIYPHSIAFSINPKINAVIRVGKDEEKEDLFRALCGVEESSVNSRTGKTETLPQKMKRVSGNVHKRQKTTRDKWAKKFKAQIEENNLNDNAFILIQVDEKFDRELGGVIASSISQEYRKPTLIMVWNEEKKSYTGSLRGHDSVTKNTKDFLEGLELFNYLGGHQQACGFGINKDKLFTLNETINSKVEELDNGVTDLVGVDFVITESQVSVELTQDVYQYEYLWGKGATTPQFAVHMTVDTSKIKKSNSSNMIEWYHNDVKFVQFSGDIRLIDLMADGRIVDLTLIGSISVNHFLGRATPQFLIESMGIGELKEGFAEIEEVESKDILDDLFDW